MNLYGVATGTNTYSLRVQEQPGSQLRVGDTITLNLLNANTGASTLSINGRDSIPMFVNGADAASGALRAGKDLQFTFTGSSLNLDVGDSILSADDIRSALGGDDQFVIATGSATTWAANPTVPWTSYVDGAVIRVRAPDSNTGSCTLNVSGLGPKPIYKQGGWALLAGGEMKTGCVYDFRYTLADSIGYFALTSCYTLAPGDFTGPFILTGTQSSPGASVNSIYRDFGGNMWYNSGSVTNHNFSTNNVGNVSIGATGIIFSPNQSLYSASYANIYCDTSGNLNSNVPAGSAHIERVSGVEQLRVDEKGVHHLKNTFVAALAPGEFYVANDLHPLRLAAATRNDGFISVSGTYNEILTFLVDCSIQISLATWGSNGAVAQFIAQINEQMDYPSIAGQVVAASNYPCLNTTIRVEAGDELRILVYPTVDTFLPDLSSDIRKFLRITKVG